MMHHNVARCQKVSRRQDRPSGGHSERGLVYSVEATRRLGSRIAVVRAIASLGGAEAFEALAPFVTDTLPVTLPVDAGAKVTLNVTLWPAASVNGVVIPLAAKPLPVTLT